MMYAFSFDVDGLTLRVEESTVDALMEAYQGMGGSPKWLLASVETAVQEIEAGKRTFAAGIAAAVDQTRDPEPEPAPAKRDGWSKQGPWNRGGSESAAAERDREDPWQSGAADDGPAEERTGPSGGGSAAPVQKRDRFDRLWTLGLPEAPMCDHGEPAARVNAKAGPNAKNPGKPYTVWWCARGAPDGDYRTKCDFSEFPPR